MTTEAGEDKGHVATIELPALNEQKEEAKLTVADISDGSFTKEEIEAAKKHGLVEDPDASKDTKKVETKKPDEKPEDKADKKPPKADEGADAGADEFNLDPEKEKQFQEVFGENKTVNGFYRKMKKDRSKRQDAEAERDQVLIQKKALEDERDKLRAELTAAKTRPKDGVDEFNLDPEEEGAEKGGDEKPLTRSDLDRIEQEKADKAKTDADTNRKRLEKASEKLDDHQEDAKLRYKDFDTVMDLTTDVMKNVETMFPDPREQKKVILKIRTFMAAAANADKFDVDDYNPADMAYEIGLLHPKYKSGGTDEIADEGADLSPDKLKKIAANASRRTSASINGGAGRRLVSVDNLTKADVADMSSDEFKKLRKSNPEVVERLLRQ